MIDLQTKDILQINATIIAGGLIFLTLVDNVINAKFTALTYATVILLITMLIFAVSCYVALKGNKDDALRLMKLGFIIIFVFVLAVFIALAINGAQEAVQRVYFKLTKQNITNQNITNQTIVSHQS